MSNERDLFRIDHTGTAPFDEVRLSHVLRTVEIDSDLLHPELHDNLMRLTTTRILGDELAAIGYFATAASHLETQVGGFTEDAVAIVRQSTILSDSGKAGWRGAHPDLKRAITQLHSEDRIFELHRTLEEYIDEFFHDEDELQQQRLAENPSTYTAADLKRQVSMMADQGVTLDMTMRDFFDLHVRWTHDLIMASNVERKSEIATTAGLHHFLEANIPFSINPLTEDINSLITREAIWVIVLDKYDAQVRRSNASPAEAIEWLLAYIEQAARGFDLVQVGIEREQLKDRFRIAIRELAASLGV